MDLRPLSLSSKQVETAARVLDYQPFFVSDELQTGVAYSWIHWHDPEKNPPIVFRRAKWDGEWSKISDSNGRLRRMYDDWISEISTRYKGGTLLDVACNNGYFPVRAQTMGMGRCVGSDLGGHYASSIKFLNDNLGTNAEFVHAPYDPRSHNAPIVGKYDVVVASTVLYHLPDPTNYMAFLGSVAKEAIFFFDQVIDTDSLLVSFSAKHLDPYDNLQRAPFPYGFNTDTRVSRGMFRHAMERMGFQKIVELPWREEWLSPYLLRTHETRRLDRAAVDRLGRELPTIERDFNLAREIEGNSRFSALLAMR